LYFSKTIGDGVYYLIGLFLYICRANTKFSDLNNPVFVLL